MSAIPFTISVFGNFYDKGYGLSKTFSILVVGYLSFILSILKIAPFSAVTVIFVSGTFATVNLFIYFKNRPKITSGHLRVFVFQEILFSLGLSLWTYVRSHQPDINGLEKLMDFGFINSLNNTNFLPPEDMWAAGHPINYYWYGHFITSLLTKLSGVPSGFAYNLMLGTILGLSLTTVFSFISSLLWNSFKHKHVNSVIVGGLISAVLINFAGSFHTPYYILKDGLDKYWYPDATRFIGYNPDIDDKTIHEFPIYSYVVSDLHAHLLNLPFVLFFLALLYNHLKTNKKSSRQLDSKPFLHTGYLWQKSLLPLLGAVLGIMFMTNAWDLANYALTAGLVLGMNKLLHVNRKNWYKIILELLADIAIIIFSAIFVSIPFLMNFESIAQGVALTHTKTPFWQMAILWGFPAILTTLLATLILISKKRGVESLFITAIFVASWLLILIPEYVYLKDIYAQSHYRANTMFKLTYQAYVMFYLASGYIIVKAIKKTKALASKLVLVFLISPLMTSILYYPFLAVKSYYGNIFRADAAPKSLSGDGWLKEQYPDTYAATEWLRNNKNAPQPVILEAPGDSYTDFNVISSYTGLPTVSGWYVHEWLWRGSPDFPQQRVDDITKIYNTGDYNLAKSLLAKYSVKYIIVGNFEREKFPELKEQKFSVIGKLVFASGTTNIYLLE